MSNKIDQEMDSIAETMEKSFMSPTEQLIETIKELGPELLKAKMQDLTDSEKELLKATLTEMSLQKAASFDKEAAGAGYVQGKVIDTVIQEDQVSDDKDEKLVKPEGAKQYHQGTPTEGWSGQSIDDPEKKEAKGQLVDTSNLYKALASDLTATEIMFKMMSERGVSLEKCVSQMMSKGVDEERAKRLGAKASEKMEKAKKEKEADKDEKKEKDLAEKMADAVDTIAEDEAKEEVKDHEEKMHAKEMKKAAPIKEEEEKEPKKEAKKEKAEDKEELEKKQGVPKGADPATHERCVQDVKAQGKDKSSAYAICNAAGAGMKKSEEMEKGRVKEAMLSEQYEGYQTEEEKALLEAFGWSKDKELFKSDRGGRNFNFSVNDYYDQVLAKSQAEPEVVEKAESDKQDLNDLIEKSLDKSQLEIAAQAAKEEAAAKRSIQLYSSYSDSEIAAALGLTAEEAAKLLG